MYVSSLIIPFITSENTLLVFKTRKMAGSGSVAHVLLPMKDVFKNISNLSRVDGRLSITLRQSVLLNAGPYFNIQKLRLASP